MNPRHIAAGAMLALLPLMAGAAQQGQSAKSDPAPATQQTYQPKNLKVLSNSTSGAELHRVMQQYTREVGVPCEYCHAQNPQTGKTDFASDENPIKETARLMIKMTDDINRKYLTQLGDRRYSPPFSCGTCHQGLPEPPAFESKAKQEPSK